MFRTIVLFIAIIISGVAYSQNDLKGAMDQYPWTLDSCVRYAYSHNISLKRSELNVEVADQNTKASLGTLLPTLNGQATHGYNWGQRIDPFTNQFASQRVQSNNFGLATSMTLFNGMQQVNSYRQSLINEETVKWNYEKIRNDVALNVASGFLTILLNKELQAVAQNNFNNTEVQEKRIEKLVNAGQSAPSALDQIRSQLASDNATLVLAENNVRLAKLSLVLLLQLDPSDVDAFEIVTPELESINGMNLISNPNIAVQSALNNFPEIKSAQTGLASAQMGERVARGAMAPRLTMSYSYGTGYSGAAKVLTGSPDSLSFPIGQVLGSNQLVFSFPQAVYTPSDYAVKPFKEQLNDNINKSLFFNLTIPIFNGFSVASSMQKARISRIDAELQLEQAKQTLTQNVQRSYADALAALANYNAAKQSVSAGEKSFQWSQLRFEQGVSNAAEYNDARRILDNAKANLTRYKFDYVFKLKILEFYQGQPISLK